MLLWPARVVTPDATYDPCHFRHQDGLAEVLDKQGKVLVTLAGAEKRLVAEGAQTGQHNVTQRWQVVSPEGRWLAELTTGCGCGGTGTRGTNPAELAW